MRSLTAPMVRGYVLTAAAVAALIVLVCVFRVVQRYDPSRAERNEPLGDISLRLDRSEIVSRFRGIPEWSLKAARMVFHQSQGDAIEGFRVAEFSGITDGVMYRAGTPEGSFRADRATMDRSLNRFDVTGNIQVVTTRGDSISADTLVWSPRDDFARFPAGVHGLVRGYRLTAPQVLFALRKRILQCPQGGEITRGRETLRAASLVWNVEQGLIECPGTVSGQRGATTFVGQDARLDQRHRRFHLRHATLTVPTEGGAAAGPIAR